MQMLHRWASPPSFYQRSGRWLPWINISWALLLVAGLVGGLFLAPPDYQQGESVRIIYIHVPSAWLSMFIYMVMAFQAAVVLIWRIRLAESAMMACAPIGAGFTFLALVTGSLWGKPMWGAWWVWDARLTSELILLFLYLGVMGLFNALPDRQTAARSVAVLVLVGVVNIPIIHFSVDWWNTLHQPATITRLDKPAIHFSMLWPLLCMALSFKLYFIASLLVRMRADLLHRDRYRHWTGALVEDTDAKPR
jgi:heme exporter protein C